VADGPTIGIPLSLDDRGRWRAGRDYDYIDTRYADAIAQAGGIPLYLSRSAPPDALLDRLDGLLLPGGDDLAPPAAYPAGAEFDLVPETQLRFDRTLLKQALARGLPTLGICYGMQLLALEAGGSLHYDLATDLPTASEHRLDEQTGRHPIEIEPGTHLAELPGDRPAVNSLHHQAVADPGAGLRVSARAPDGVIEAIESADGSFVVGVQWHPEKLGGAFTRAFFSAFVGAANAR
jgi:putative glutamine amidotransferase